MPSIITDYESKSSWADQVEEGEEELPTSQESVEDGIKTVVEYTLNNDGKRIKVIRQYKIETRKVSKSIAKRKAWRKFGAAADDKPGPNPANTIVAEDVFMTFISNKEQDQPNVLEEDPLNKIKGQKFVQCRKCKGEHWTTRCPYKDSLVPLPETLEKDKKTADGTQTPVSAEKENKSGKYIPPSMREGANRRGESMQSSRRDESATIRVTNLSEDTRDSDLKELFSPFGTIARIYLAKDKITGQSKGFAFINFNKREDAARAIANVSGFGYDHLILNVEWAKPSGSS